jgi:iron complex outermembrane recepter protein
MPVPTSVFRICLALSCSIGTMLHGYAASAADLPASSGKQGPTQKKSSKGEIISVTGVATRPDGTSNTTPGGGLMPVQTAPRSQSAVTRDYIAKQSPTSNIASLISHLPGVLAPSVDPAGVTNDHIMLRGLNETETGYVFEGVPIVDPMSYAPYTAMIVDSENIGRVQVTQGSSDLTSPLYNAVGGQIETSEITPAKQMGGYIAATGGTYGMNKEFLRLNSGEIGRTGVYGFASYSHTSYDNWRGPGGLTRHHVDARLFKEWGDNNSASISFGWTAQEQVNLVSPSLAKWEASGATGEYESSHYYPGNSSYYKLNQHNPDGLFITAPLKFNLGSGLTFHTTPYLISQHGPSIFGQNLPVTGGYFGTRSYGTLNVPYAVNGVVTTQRFDPWEQRASGLNSTLAWVHRNNTVSLSYWYAYNTHHEYAAYSPVDYAGNTPSNYESDSIHVFGGTQLRGYNYNFTQQVNTISLDDTLTLFGGRLLADAGIRAAMLTISGTNEVPGADPYRGGGSYFQPLPQIKLSYRLDRKNQIYINGTTAFRAPANVTSYVESFSPTSATPSSTPGVNLKPEYSISEEIGFRHTGLYNLSVALFNDNLTNHQLTSTAYLSGTNILVSQSINAGGETIRGVQAELGLKPWHHFSPYLSGQYLHATTDNNYDTGTDYLPTKGKIAPETPKFSGAVGLSYDNGHMFGNFYLNYVDKQYSTLMNDQAMHSYTVANATLGYRLERIGFAKSPQIMLNIVNIGDNHYLSSPTGDNPTAVARKGIFGTSVSGSEPTYNIGAPFSAYVSVSTGF